MTRALALAGKAPVSWWRHQQHGARRIRLITRNAVTRAVRAWFESEDFIEVESAALQISPGNEAHLHAFMTEIIGPDGARAPLYLRTSPEFACKKLLAAGERRIFEFARVWRNRERGALHAPEFTMLEWYRAADPYDLLMDDCRALLAVAARIGGREVFSFRGLVCDPFARPERMTVAEAFRRFAGVDLLGTLGADGEPDREALAKSARDTGERVAEDDTWSDIFSRMLVAHIEPRLGVGRPTVLCEYPVAEAALARAKPADSRVAERFELYVCGVELVNAFAELTDPAEQARRFASEMDEKARIYGERYPIDDEFLAALAQMPAACGAALGFDRLVMLATGADHIDQVQWTPMPGAD